MDNELSSTANTLAMLAIFGSLGIWALIVQKFRRGGAVLEAVPRLSVPWVGWHVLFVFLIYLGYQPIALALSGVRVADLASEQAEVDQSLAKLPPDELSRLMSYSSLFSLLAVLSGVGLLVLFSQAKEADFGLSDKTQRMFKDILLGGAGFLAALIPVFALQILVIQLVPYEHPVLEMLNSKESGRVWLMAISSAVLVAPLTEEFLFRVVLQGWLERSALKSQHGLSIRKEETESGETILHLERAPVTPQASWPVWVSACAFGLMHLGQGAAPVPLILLGAILGYLYRQTHRIVPCIALHAFFNLFSLALYWLSIPPSA